MSKIQKASNNYLILGSSTNSITPINPATYTNLDTSLNMAVDFINVVAIDSKGLIYAGGIFSSIGGVPANNVAVYNPVTNLWSSLGTGVDNYVKAIAIDASDNVYFGGIFTTAGGVSSYGIARWNPASSSWSPIGGPVSALVLSIKINPYNSNVYVGGNFTNIGPSSTPASYMAIYNPSSNTWSQFSGGTSSVVTGFVFSPTNIYICGYFSQVNGIPNFNSIASYDVSTDSWSPFGTGFNSICNTMIGVGNLLYVGGQFTSANGNGSIQYIAQINTTTGVYSALPGTPEVPAPGGAVEALISDTNNILYVGGFFSIDKPPNTIGFLKWNPTTSTWSINNTNTINNLINSGVGGFALTSLNNLYVTGSEIVLVNYYQQISQTSTFYLPLRKSFSKKWIKLNK